MVSRTCRAWDNCNPELGEIIEYMILENQGSFKEFGTGERVGQARQQG